MLTAAVSAGQILQNGTQAHVAAYPELIAIAATLLTVRPRLEQPSTPTESAWTRLTLCRINERTGAHHTDTTPIEQWVHNCRQSAGVKR